IVFALLWTFPCLQCGPSMVGPHAFHVLAGFILAALLVVCGFMFGPPADEGQVEPISSGSLAAYLLGATLIVLNSFHADTAMIAFGLLVAGSLLVAWRSDAAAGASGPAPRPHRASRPLDPVCHTRGAAGCGQCRRDRDPEQAR